ncbi:PD-(D/E)XK nuclease domain-containing protein [Amedibacillus sp. YH-ame6]
MDKYIKELAMIDTISEYDEYVLSLPEFLIKDNFDLSLVHAVKEKGKYIKNKFSDESTLENMRSAKERIIDHLKLYNTNQCIFLGNSPQAFLKQYLNEFHLFFKLLKEIEPDKRASLTSSKLQELKIKNEYDLQHILYATLKPIFKDARKEVSEDSGVATIRSDIKLPEMDGIIEMKCTRENMSYKKLIEEIEADIVHYRTSFIYFYIYDKERKIKDSYTFLKNFNRDFDGKHICTIVYQP